MTDGPGVSAKEPVSFRVPPPNTLRYNNWRQLPVPGAGSFSPTEAVTVVIPYFEAPAALEALLAGLERQTYPRELFEAVIVDDGSATPLGQPSSPLAVRVIRQENCGFGLARARNNGARAAAHDILIFLDGDMIPDTDLLAAHARWHHAVADAVTLGFRAAAPEAIDIAALRRHSGSLRDLYGQRECDAWREPLLVQSADLCSRHGWPFRTMVGANFAVRKAFYLSVGGCDESFVRYGGEDTELAYRAYAQGAVLVPARGAMAWHQEAPGADEAHKHRQLQAQRAKLANLIPHSAFRAAPGAVVHVVPRYVVTLRPECEPAETVARAVENILSDALGDVVVRIEAGRLQETDLVWLDEFYVADARVRIVPLRAALDEFPAAPMHIVLPAGPAVDHGIVAHLRKHLGTAVQATAPLPGRGKATITRAWALHRARRTGRPVTAFGAAVAAPAPKRRRAGSSAQPLPNTQPGVVARSLAALAREARYVQGPRTAMAMLRWMARGLRRRLGHPGLRAAVAPDPAGVQRRDRAFGVEIAVAGERSGAVFAASSRVRRYQAGRRADVVLADTRAAAGIDAAGNDAPIVILADRPRLSVPAFDPAVHNPIGWRRTVENRVATLGPPHLLPSTVRQAREVSARDRRALLTSHHLVDSGAFHADPASRAGVLVRLAAAGVPVCLVDRDTALEACLGPELAALMSVRLDPADADARESLSVRMRRVALRDHSLRSRATQVCEVALADPPVPPKVSILLATKRPELLYWTVANVARQNYPNLELVIALHGDGFADLGADLERLPCPVKVLRLDRQRVLGSVLNAAAEAASGVLLTKMDDDDLYGADHVWDLVLAHEYSGAHLVGKGIENVYLREVDRTVQRQSGQAETYSDDLAGGTLLMARQDLARFGGWPRVPRAEDILLIGAILDAGGRVYRTHGAGFVLIRHGAGHTWDTRNTFFLDAARRTHAGWRPDIADIATDALCPSPP